MRRIGAWIALAGMILVLILPLIPRSALAAAAGIDATVICTAYGIDILAADADGRALPDKTAAGVHCPLCIGSGGGWALAAPLPLPFRLPPAGTRLPTVIVQLDPPPPFAAAVQPNAPRPPPTR